VVSYHKKYGDEITFIPGAYFSPMYNTREQTNRDLHDGLKLVSEMVGGGYRPLAVIGGFMAAENLRYLAEEEGIHVCQGNIWSQYAVDNGDGEGSISYPYYPSREHFCKPARGKKDLIDCVNLDGWTVDFLNARIPSPDTSMESDAAAGRVSDRLKQFFARVLRRDQRDISNHCCAFDTGFALNKFCMDNLYLGAESGRGAQWKERTRWP